LRCAAQQVASLRISDLEFETKLFDAFVSVPREHFVDPPLAPRAYGDTALPIGFGQTISRPATVLKMRSALAPVRGERALEIGTGSGYVSALLSALGLSVYSLEKVAPLAQRARKQLDALRFETVLIRCADGMKGWPDYAPFDVIIVSAAVDKVPEELLQQLAPGGRLVAPVNISPLSQRLELWRAGASLERTALGPCHFVAACS